MGEITSLEVKTPVVDSVIDLFDTMLSMEAEAVEPEDFPGWEGPRIAGSISFAGEIAGNMMVQVTEDFAAVMTAEMLGMEVDEIEGEDEIKDVILEVCNILAGNLKSTLNDSGLSCVISTPTLTMGKNFDVETLNMARYEKFTFRCQGQNFLVEVCLKAAEDASPEALKRLTSIDISKFERLDIISSAGYTVIELFDMMLSMKLDLSGSESVQDIEGVRTLGMINFAGEVMGSLNLQLSHTFARIITSKMIDKPLEEVKEEEEIKDVIGELCNIVAGNLKSGFCDSGLKCEISPPSITVGDDFRIETLNMARYEQFVFKFYEHDIFVQVCVKIDESAKAPADGAMDAASIDEIMAQANAPADEKLDTAAIDEIMAEAKESGDEQLDSAAIDAIMAETKGSVDAPEDSVGGETQAAPVEALPDMENDIAPEVTPGIKDETAIQEDRDGGIDLMAVSPNLDFILNIPVDISVELGRAKITIGRLRELGPGSPVILSSLENEDLDIFANNKLIAKGEVIVENEKYGIRVTEVVSRMERIKGLGE